MKRVKQGYMANICFDCKKACGGCSWSANFEPVDGWDAEKVKFNNGYKCDETYHIKACPLFEPEEPRTHTTGEISDEDFRMLMSVWKWREEHGK